MHSNISLLFSATIVSLACASTIKVDVGSGGLVFTPNSTAAAVGDVVEFHFRPKKHNVVQSTFDSPCNFNSLPNGFYSGFMPVDSGEGPAVFRVTINDTKPIWFYCGQGSHCQAGMVGVINEPTSGNTLAEYKASAAKAGNSTNPVRISGGVVAPNDSASSGTASGTATGTPTGGSAASTSASGTAAAGTGSSTASSSSASASASKSAAGSYRFVSWIELLGIGAVAAGAAVYLQ